MIKILYKDKNILICEKPIGIPSERTTDGQEGIADILCRENEIDTLFIVHRLDRNVSGVMLIAKNKAAAGKFSALVSEQKLNKEYFAVVHGKPDEDCGIYKDLLFRDSSSGKTFVTDKMRKGVKEASLEYRTLATVQNEDGELSLVRIKLHTGRTHQIRTQFASRQMPLFGDGKYGSHTNRGNIALFATRLSFLHPFTKKEIDIQLLPEENYPFDLFSDILNKGIFGEKIL